MVWWVDFAFVFAVCQPSGMLILTVGSAKAQTTTVEHACTCVLDWCEAQSVLPVALSKSRFHMCICTHLCNVVATMYVNADCILSIISVTVMQLCIHLAGATWQTPYHY